MNAVCAGPSNGLPASQALPSQAADAAPVSRSHSTSAPNSSYLLIAKQLIRAGSSVAVVKQKNQSRLCLSRDPKGLLTPAATRRACYAWPLRGAGPTAMPRGFSPGHQRVREARQRREFLQMVQGPPGFEVILVSGPEEARLNLSGVLSGMASVISPLISTWRRSPSDPVTGARCRELQHPGRSGWPI